MKIQTVPGKDLTTTGSCKQACRKLSTMKFCPIKRFDDYGDICRPDICQHYTMEEIKPC